MTSWVRNLGQAWLGDSSATCGINRDMQLVDGLVWEGPRRLCSHVWQFEEVAGRLGPGEWSAGALHVTPPACQPEGRRASNLVIQSSQRACSERPELKPQVNFNTECPVLVAKQVSKSNPDSRGRALDSSPL